MFGIFRLERIERALVPSRGVHAALDAEPLEVVVFDRALEERRRAPAERAALGLDQLELGPLNPTTSGAVIGDYQGVRDSVLDGMESMLTQGTKPKAALKAAKSDGDAKIQEYNSRIGA